jgi:hypothetical protein
MFLKINFIARTRKRDIRRDSSGILVIHGCNAMLSEKAM